MTAAQEWAVLPDEPTDAAANDLGRLGDGDDLQPVEVGRSSLLSATTMAQPALPLDAQADGRPQLVEPAALLDVSEAFLWMSSERFA